MDDGADEAGGAFRRADDFAEFHEGLIPVAGRLSATQKILRGFGEGGPVGRSAEFAVERAVMRARTRATLPSRTARGTS